MADAERQPLLKEDRSANYATEAPTETAENPTEGMNITCIKYA